MKLVLLPGMDGSGELFQGFIQCFDGDVVVLPLPEGADQSYRGLSAKIAPQLPDADFILLVESFSGGLVAHLLGTPNLRGVVFVASFVSRPNSAMLFIAGLLPRKALTYLPGSFLASKFLFFGQQIQRDIFDRFVGVVRRLSKNSFDQRLKAMSTLSISTASGAELPCVYIRPKQDRLIDENKALEVLSLYENSVCYALDGPHFVLQAKPERSAKLVRQACDYIENFDR